MGLLLWLELRGGWLFCGFATGWFALLVWVLDVSGVLGLNGCGCLWFVVCATLFNSVA